MLWFDTGMVCYGDMASEGTWPDTVSHSVEVGPALSEVQLLLLWQGCGQPVSSFNLAFTIILRLGTYYVYKDCSYLNILLPKMAFKICLLLSGLLVVSIITISDQSRDWKGIWALNLFKTVSWSSFSIVFLTSNLFFINPRINYLKRRKNEGE